MRAQLLHRIDRIEEETFKQLAGRKGFIRLSEVLSIIRRMLTEFDNALLHSNLSAEQRTALRKDVARRWGELREPETKKNVGGKYVSL